MAKKPKMTVTAAVRPAPITANSSAPEMVEIASIRRDITVPFFGNVMRNTDATLMTRGGVKGLHLYDEVERDARAYSVLQKRKLAVISRPWTVKPASDSPRDVAAAELVTRNFQSMQFDRICTDLFDATLKGFSVAEIMWEVRDGEVVARDLIARDQTRFVFTLDRDLRLRTRAAMIDGEELPQRKFVIHRFGAKDGSPYGLGLGHKIFWPVFFKRQDITFWLTFADKFASPTIVGKYPNGTPKDEQDKLFAALHSIHQDSAVTVPEGMLIELLEAARTGAGDFYEKLARYMDEQISEIVLSDAGKKSDGGLGSGKAEVDDGVRLEISKADSDLLSDTLNDTLVRWIVEYNDAGAGLPKVERDFSEQEDLAARAARDKSLSEMGWEPSEKYMLETYGEGWTKKAPPVMALPFGTDAVPVDSAPANASADLTYAQGLPLQSALKQGRSNAAKQATLVAASEQLAAGWRELVGRRVEDVMSVLDETGDLVQFREQMARLVDTPPDVKTVESIARATFASHIIGRGEAPAPAAARSITDRLKALMQRRNG